MRVFVDADNCAKDSRKIILKACTRQNIQVFLVANRNIPIANENVKFTMVVCNDEKDSADNYIVENTTASDIAITRDILLAERLVNKKVFSLNDKGKIFTADNIGDFLEQRKLSLQMKSLGITNGTLGKGNTQAETSEFSKRFNEALSKLIPR